MSSKFILKVVEGAKRGQEFVFDEHDTLLFGRMDDCHICLPDDNRVSRHHFILEVNPPDARIRDLGSLNGTHVNGKKYGGREEGESPEAGAKRQYPQVDLHDGDEIRVGGTTMKVNLELSVECVECGAPIPEPREKYAWVGETYICASCRKKHVAQEQRQPEKRVRKPKPPEPVRCQQCGKDVSVEVGPGRRGDYVCEACREEAVSDPIALLMMALLKRARQPAEPELNIPDYEVERKLGEGGMGAVYLVRHKKKGTRAALKVMLSKVAVDERSRKVFMREIEVTRALRHKNIVGFLDHGSAGGVFYFLLEFCEGGSVDKLMERRGGRLALDEAGPIILQSLEGLAFAHDKDFIHRDLKPQNILLTGSEPHWTAKVADMGLAKDFQKAGWSGMTATGSFGGSFAFMAREQVTNFKYFKPVSDVWSMGATFYNMLTGQFPRDFRRGQDPMEVILHGSIVPIAKRGVRLPSRVAEVIDHSLSNKTSDRYQNAGEMLLALKKVL